MGIFYYFVTEAPVFLCIIFMHDAQILLRTPLTLAHWRLACLRVQLVGL